MATIGAILDHAIAYRAERYAADGVPPEPERERFCAETQTPEWV